MVLELKKILKYTSIRSCYIRQRMAETADKEYIDKLLFLEWAIIYPSRLGFAGNLGFHSLRATFPVEYEHILKELDPERFVREKNNVRSERKRELQRKKAQSRAERREHEEFQQALSIFGSRSIG
jgi:hypothetical protein